MSCGGFIIIFIFIPPLICICRNIEKMIDKGNWVGYNKRKNGKNIDRE